MPTADERTRDWNSHAKAGWIAAWLIVNRTGYTTTELCNKTLVTKQGVEYIIEAMIAGGLPIRRVHGRWKWIGE